MMSRTLYDPALIRELKVGVVWERTRGKSEPAVKIVKAVNARLGRRYLVEGLESGRQWLVMPSTLLDTYQPRQRHA